MKLTVTTFVSMDGVMQAPGGPGEDDDNGFAHEGWLAPYPDEDFGRFMTGVFEHAEAFLLGRRTYQIFAAYWPQQGDDPIANPLNALPKHVASTTLTDLDWEGASVIRGDLVEGVRELKAAPGKELQVHGSSNLLKTLQQHDLVDTYRLLTFPVVLGSGKRLFDAGSAPVAFRLADSSTSSTGVSLQTYERVGAVETGDVR
jgi:dihydrofolate reductase